MCNQQNMGLSHGLTLDPVSFWKRNKDTRERENSRSNYLHLEVSSSFLLKIPCQVAKDNYARRETFGRIPRTIPVSHAETLRQWEAKPASWGNDFLVTTNCSPRIRHKSGLAHGFGRLLGCHWCWFVFYRFVLSASKLGAGASHTRIQCLSFPFPSAHLGLIAEWEVFILK